MKIMDTFTAYLVDIPKSFIKAMLIMYTMAIFIINMRIIGTNAELMYPM